MPKFATGAIGTAAALLVAVLGVGLLGRVNQTSPGIPAASSSPSASAPAAAPPSSPAASASPAKSSPSASSRAAAPVDTTDWVAYTSEQYGFTVAHPKDWVERPATRDWTMAEDRVNYLTSAAEGFEAPDYQNYASAFSANIPAGSSKDAWLATYEDQFNECESITTETGAVDGHAATIRRGCGESQAFVFIGDRVYVFSIWSNNDRRISDPALASVKEGLLDAFILTVHFGSAG